MTSFKPFQQLRPAAKESITDYARRHSIPLDGLKDYLQRRSNSGSVGGGWCAGRVCRRASVAWCKAVAAGCSDDGFTSISDNPQNRKRSGFMQPPPHANKRSLWRRLSFSIQRESSGYRRL
jgi:hypothetical protein